MDVSILTNPLEFALRAGDFLASEPISANVLAVVNEQTIAADPNPSLESVWILVTDDSGSVIGAAMANGPWNLFLPRMPAGAPALIADELTHFGRSIPGLFGETDSAAEFIRQWSACNAHDSTLTGNRECYVLDHLCPPTVGHGSARRFRIGEASLVAEWLGIFHDEAVPEDPVIDYLDEARRRIGDGQLWAWTVDDTPVALTACSAPAAGVARIGPVYTPVGLRGRGYGGGATAAAVQAAEAAGAAHVMLYTDTANATSNALYQRLGFVLDHRAVQYAFA